MEENTFNLELRRKLLHKRKRRRQFFVRSFFLLLILLFILIPFFSFFKSDNSFIATINQPQKSTPDEFVVCIDPGHGDWDIGAEGTNGTKEKDIVLQIGLKLGELLSKEENIRVVYTRTTDKITWVSTANDSLKERLKIPKISNANLFVSIHCNSNYNSVDSRGVETWYNPDSVDGKNFSQMLQDELVKLNYSPDRGLKYYASKDDALAVLEKNTTTASLVEVGFLSNKDDEYYLKSDSGQTAIAKALMQGILNYKNSLDNIEN